MRMHKWKLFALGFVILTLTWLLIPSSRTIPLNNGASARVKLATFIRSLRQEAFCTITYEPKEGQSGAVILWQSIFDGPMMLISSTNANVLYCLYDYDVDVRLFGIDTSKRFKPLPSSNDINSILFTSTWEIQYGADSDWQEVLNYLQKASSKDFKRHLLPSSFRFFRASTDAHDVIHYLSYQGIKPCSQ